MRRKVAYVLTRTTGPHDMRPQYRSTPAWPRKRAFKLKGNKKKKGDHIVMPRPAKLLFYITKRRQGLHVIFIVKHHGMEHTIFLE